MEIRHPQQGQKNFDAYENNKQSQRKNGLSKHHMINDNSIVTRRKIDSFDYKNNLSIKSNDTRPDINRISTQKHTEMFPLMKENYTQHKNQYVKFKKKDNPKTGDFSCLGSLSTTSCVFIFHSVQEAAVYCENMGPYCKGFVEDHSTSEEKFIVYFKNKIGILKENDKTNFYVKKEFYDIVRFKQ